MDLAAAQGNVSLLLAETGYDVIWNDLRADLSDYVRLKHEKGSISYLPGNCFDIFANTLFDAVLIAEIIEHVAHPDDFLSKVADLVRPGGWVVMSTPNGAYFRNRLPKFSECPDPGIYESVQFKPNSDGHFFFAVSGGNQRFGESSGPEDHSPESMYKPANARAHQIKAAVTSFAKKDRAILRTNDILHGRQAVEMDQCSDDRGIS